MKESEKNSKLELEYSDIFKYHPNWVIRWGITTVTFLILFLIISTIYIDDSETVKVKAELIFNNTQIVYSHNNYNNYKILVDNNSYVNKGTYLILFDSTASIKEVVRLSNLLSIFGSSESNSRFYFEDLKSDFNNIRALKPFYDSFYNNYNEYLNTYSRKDFLKQKDINGLNAKHNKMKESFDSLKTRLDKWIGENTAKAEISGFVVYNQNDNQIKSGDKGIPLLTIHPLNENKEVTCKLFFNLSEKEKLTGKTNYNIKLHISENGKSILFYSDIGNVYYDKDKNIYTAEVLIKEYNVDLFSGFENRFFVECKADIVVENKSLFSSLFEKYKNIKKM